MVRLFFDIIIKLFLTVLVLLAMGLYVVSVLLPMILMSILIGVVMGITVYSFWSIYKECQKGAVGWAFLLIIFFPLAIEIGIYYAFKEVWGQSVLFWWRLIVDAVVEPTLDIWNY